MYKVSATQKDIAVEIRNVSNVQGGNKHPTSSFGRIVRDDTVKCGNCSEAKKVACMVRYQKPSQLQNPNFNDHLQSKRCNTGCAHQQFGYVKPHVCF